MIVQNLISVYKTSEICFEVILPLTSLRTTHVYRQIHTTLSGKFLSSLFFWCLILFSSIVIDSGLKLSVCNILLIMMIGWSCRFLRSNRMSSAWTSLTHSSTILVTFSYFEFHFQNFSAHSWRPFCFIYPYSQSGYTGFFWHIIRMK